MPTLPLATKDAYLVCLTETLSATTTAVLPRRSPKVWFGWGAAPGARFHDFAIFIAPESKAPRCIVFEIGIHVVVDDGQTAASEQEHVKRERIKVRGRPATRASSV